METTLEIYTNLVNVCIFALLSKKSACGCGALYPHLWPAYLFTSLSTDPSTPAPSKQNFYSFCCSSSCLHSWLIPCFPVPLHSPHPFCFNQLHCLCGLFLNSAHCATDILEPYSTAMLDPLRATLRVYGGCSIPPNTNPLRYLPPPFAITLTFN